MAWEHCAGWLDGLPVSFTLEWWLGALAWVWVAASFFDWDGYSKCSQESI